MFCFLVCLCGGFWLKLRACEQANKCRNLCVVRVGCCLRPSSPWLSLTARARGAHREREATPPLAAPPGLAETPEKVAAAKVDRRRTVAATAAAERRWPPGAPRAQAARPLPAERRARAAVRPRAERRARAAARPRAERPAPAAARPLAEMRTGGGVMPREAVLPRAARRARAARPRLA